MAAPQTPEQEQEHFEKLLSSYLGLSFTIFLSFLPKNSVSSVSRLQTHTKDLSFKLKRAEEQVKQLHSRRKEDSKANARVVEIFATHRHSWQQQEKSLSRQIDDLRGKFEDFKKLESDLRDNIYYLRRERDEMLNFISMNSGRANSEMENNFGGRRGGDGDGGGGECYSEIGLNYGKDGVSEGVHNMEEIGNLYGQSNGFSNEFLNSSSKFWAEKGSIWQQDVQYEPVEPLYNLKHFVSRRESPWKVDGDSTGVSSKLKLLEQELVNLERIDKADLTKMPSLLSKQAKRYQALAGKIDDLCRRMSIHFYSKLVIHVNQHSVQSSGLKDKWSFCWKDFASSSTHLKLLRS